MLSCPMLTSMTDLIEGIFAFVFFHSHSLYCLFSYSHLPVHFSTLFSSFIISLLLKRIMNPQALILLQSKYGRVLLSCPV